MKKIVVLSGKGGTGKTTIATYLIDNLPKVSFADCDVDAPNLHLMQPSYKKVFDGQYKGYMKAVINKSKCIECGKCEASCQFGAIKNFKVDIYACEGCSVCELVCSKINGENNKAISLQDQITGMTQVKKNHNQYFSTAKLSLGSGASGKLVSEVKNNLNDYLSKEEYVIIDGSPGIGCPVIASLTGVDRVLLVVEPSLSGFHDMKRIIKTAKQFTNEIKVCINKWDINQKISNRIIYYCNENSIHYIGQVPYDPMIGKMINQGNFDKNQLNERTQDGLENILKKISEV